MEMQCLFGLEVGEMVHNICSEVCVKHRLGQCVWLQGPSPCFVMFWLLSSENCQGMGRSNVYISLVKWIFEAGALCASVLRPTFSVCERGGQVQILL